MAMKRRFEALKRYVSLGVCGLGPFDAQEILSALEFEVNEAVRAAVSAERTRFISLCEQAMDAVPCPENDAETAQSLTAYALADSAFRGDTTLRHRPALAPYFVAKAK